MWVDAKGVKQFSDRPPPTDVPLKNILRAPKGQQSATSMAAEAAAAATLSASAPAPAVAPAAAAKQPASLADLNADFAKRQKDRAAADKKEQEAKERRLAEAESCERNRSARGSLDSGRRIIQTGQNGEQGYMNDAQRAEEARRLDKMLAGCPKA